MELSLEQREDSEDGLTIRLVEKANHPQHGNYEPFIG
jgi:hypothetical protein